MPVHCNLQPHKQSMEQGHLYPSSRASEWQIRRSIVLVAARMMPEIGHESAEAACRTDSLNAKMKQVLMSARWFYEVELEVYCSQMISRFNLQDETNGKRVRPDPQKAAFAYGPSLRLRAVASSNGATTCLAPYGQGLFLLWTPTPSPLHS
jgi:hypothetical protein